jgi:hypothetical protein
VSELAQKSGGKLRRSILRGRDADNDEERQLMSPDQMQAENDALFDELAERSSELDVANGKLDAIKAILDGQKS